MKSQINLFLFLLLFASPLLVSAQKITYSNNAQAFIITNPGGVDPQAVDLSKNDVNEKWSFYIRTGDGTVLHQNAVAWNLMPYQIAYTYKGGAVPKSFSGTFVATRKYNPKDPKNKLSDFTTASMASAEVPPCRVSAVMPMLELSSNNTEALENETVYVVAAITSIVPGNLFICYNDIGFMGGSCTLTTTSADKVGDIAPTPLDPALQYQKESPLLKYENMTGYRVNGLTDTSCHKKVYFKIQTSNGFGKTLAGNYTIQAYFIPDPVSALPTAADDLVFATGPHLKAHDPNNQLVNLPLLPATTPLGTELEYTINFENIGQGPVKDTVQIDTYFPAGLLNLSAIQYSNVYAELQGKKIIVSPAFVSKGSKTGFDTLHFILLRTNELNTTISNMVPAEQDCFKDPVSTNNVLLCGNLGDVSAGGIKRKGFIRFKAKIKVNDRPITGWSEIRFSDAGGEVVKTNFAETNFFVRERPCPVKILKPRRIIKDIRDNRLIEFDRDKGRSAMEEKQ
jgi:hypothetical protein